MFITQNSKIFWWFCKTLIYSGINIKDNSFNIIFISRDNYLDRDSLKYSILHNINYRSKVYIVIIIILLLFSRFLNLFRFAI